MWPGQSPIKIEMLAKMSEVTPEVFFIFFLGKTFGAAPFAVRDGRLVMEW